MTLPEFRVWNMTLEIELVYWGYVLCSLNALYFMRSAEKIYTTMYFRLRRSRVYGVSDVLQVGVHERMAVHVQHLGMVFEPIYLGFLTWYTMSSRGFVVQHFCRDCGSELLTIRASCLTSRGYFCSIVF